MRHRPQQGEFGTINQTVLIVQWVKLQQLALWTMHMAEEILPMDAGRHANGIEISLNCSGGALAELSRWKLRSAHSMNRKLDFVIRLAERPKI